MKFKLKTVDLSKIAAEKADATIVLYNTDFKLNDDQLALFIKKLKKSGDFSGEDGQLLQSYGLADTAFKHLILVGVTASSKSVAAATAAAWQALAKMPVKTANILLLGQDWQADSLQLVARETAAAHYSYTATKTAKSLPKAAVALKEVNLVSTQPVSSQLQQDLLVAQALVEGINLTKAVGDLPANYATPSYLASVAQKLAKQDNVSCEVLDEKAIAALKMGSFLGVAQGSQEPPRLIVLQYNGAAKNEAPYALVGKGITFDSGGISLKPAGDMDHMKFDMCGAGSVLGVFAALAKYQPKINVVGVIAACENLPSSKALKPSDVVTSMNGQTIEILNTDAEGRLVLCDALTYALRFKPKTMIDIATLTGACVIALGNIRCGMYANDEALAQQLQQAGEQADDLCWRMPLDNDYEKPMETNFADIANANVADRGAGSITAAKFLQRFVEDSVWAHLDVAGVAYRGGKAKGATGRPVALLFNYLLNQAADANNKA